MSLFWWPKLSLIISVKKQEQAGSSQHTNYFYRLRVDFVMKVESLEQDRSIFSILFHPNETSFNSSMHDLHSRRKKKPQAIMITYGGG